MLLSDLSIKRPVFATMMILALVVLGIFSYRRLSIDLFPDVEFPFLVIQTRYPGARPFQLSGPPVVLADPFSATTTFQAPNVSVNTGLTFDVLVTDLLTGQQGKATTLVTVTPGVVRADTVVITAALYKARSGVLQVNATSSDQSCAAILTIQALASNGATLLPPNTNMQVSNIVLGGCAYTYQSGKAIFPPAGTTLSKITVISSEGGSDVCPNGTSCTIVLK